MRLFLFIYFTLVVQWTTMTLLVKTLTKSKSFFRDVLQSEWIHSGYAPTVSKEVTYA
jgi:hypothetical protein